MRSHASERTMSSQESARRWVFGHSSKWDDEQSEASYIYDSISNVESSQEYEGVVLAADRTLRRDALKRWWRVLCSLQSLHRGWSLRLALFITLVVCVVAAGLLNHVRGGWNPANVHWKPTSGNVLTHDIGPRALFGVATAVVAAVFCRNRPSIGWRCFLCAYTFVLMTLSLYIGWGVYFNIGHGDSEGYRSRPGVFDWLVGHDCKGYDGTHRFFVEYTGMSLRGLAWTFPVGVLLYFTGYGWTYLASGASMGSIYAVSWEFIDWFHCELPHQCADHTYWAEPLWGGYITLSLMAAILCFHDRPSEQTLLQYRERERTLAPRHKYMPALDRIFFFALFFTLEVIFIASCLFYNQVDQSDMRNRNQSLLGIYVVTFVPLLVWLGNSVFIIVRTRGQLFLRALFTVVHDASYTRDRIRRADISIQVSDASHLSMEERNRLFWEAVNEGAYSEHTPTEQLDSLGMVPYHRHRPAEGYDVYRSPMVKNGYTPFNFVVQAIGAISLLQLATLLLVGIVNLLFFAANGHMCLRTRYFPEK